MFSSFNNFISKMNLTSPTALTFIRIVAIIMLETWQNFYFCFVFCYRNEGFIPSNYVAENKLTNLEIYE